MKVLLCALLCAFFTVLGCGGDTPLTPSSNDGDTLLTPSSNDIAYITAESQFFPATEDAGMEVRRNWLGRLGEVSGIVSEVLIGTDDAWITLQVGNKSVECDMSAYPDESSLRQMARERSSLTIRGTLEVFRAGRVWMSGCWIIGIED